MGDNLDQIRLQKSRVQANLSDNLPLEDAEGNPEARGNWLNLSGLVSDIYHAFQFEPFSRKIVMLLKPINFNWPDGLRSLINKHVILRNCIQHHDGRLPAPFLKRWCEQHQEGHMEIADTPEPMTLRQWKPILFTEEGLIALRNALLAFAAKVARNFNTVADAGVSSGHRPINASDDRSAREEVAANPGFWFLTSFSIQWFVLTKHSP